MKRLYVQYFIVLLIAGGLFSLHSCKKKDLTAVNPYAVNKTPEAITFLDVTLDPVSGPPGSQLVCFIRGLQGLDTGKYSVYVNQVKAQVLSVQDSAVTLIVPETASSGSISVVLNGQNYFGPVFTVEDKVDVDQNFATGTGFTTNSLPGTINSFYVDPQNDLLTVVGNFTDYNGNATTTVPINGIASLSLSKGTYISLKNVQEGIGTSGSINSLLYFNSQYYLFGSFNQYGINYSNINNITRVFSNNGALDTTKVEFINTDPFNHPENDSGYVPSFNGGVALGRGQVVKAFWDTDTSFVCIGNFGEYKNYYYYRSTYQDFVPSNVFANQFIRLYTDGSLDSAYNMDPVTHEAYTATNGFINNAIQLSNGQIIVAGSFTRFGNANAGRIARLINNGQMDNSFNAGGAGADGDINTITYNAATGRIMITGNFQHYNGVAAPGVAMLNTDGTLDATFRFGKVANGSVNYAGQLSDGKIIVSGSFSSYNGLYRKGFLILNADGSLASGYNNLGAFLGQITNIYETTSSLGNPAVLILGNFSLFNNETYNGIVKIEILP